MKIAIHYNNHKYSFCHKWIDYCQLNNIDYKLVNAYDTDIISQLNDCDVFLWHFFQTDYRDMLFAKQLLYSLQVCGKKVFPDFNTGWHFDDKVGQKYLLEAIDAPLVSSDVFYKKEEAFDWINQTSFPKVFKLRGGAGAVNVHLVKSKKQAFTLVHKAFKKGFKAFNRWGNFKDKIQKYRIGNENLLGIAKGFARLVLPTTFGKMYHNEKGYVYFQEFLPNNDYDIRLIVIGNKAYGMKRRVRKNDFRASGSSDFIYDEIPKSVLQIGFDVSKRLNLQSVAFDFIFKNGKPLIIELSCFFGSKGSSKCKGYWDDECVWHEGPFEPMYWQIENLIFKDK